MAVQKQGRNRQVAVLLGCIFLTGFIFFPFFPESKAQVPVQVNHLTGAPSVSLPLWQVSSQDVSYPVVLSYQTNGIPAGAGPGQVGMGWQISSGGMISRVVRGLPDDLNEPARKGWLHGSAANVQAFSPVADENYANASDENSDYNALAAFGGFDNTSTIYDTEPDIFYLNVPGLGGKIIFDATGKPATIPYMDVDIRVTYEIDRIKGFTIGLTNGITYHFDLATYTTVQSASHNEAQIIIGKNDYYAYKTQVGYYSNFYLTAITSLEGGNISFEYYKPEIRAGESPYQVIDYSPYFTDSLFTWHYSPATGKYVKHSFYVKQYYVEQPYALAAIKSDLERVVFKSGLVSIPLAFKPNPDWQMRPVDLRQPLIYAVDIYETARGRENLVKRYLFDYTYYRSRGLRPIGTVPTWYPFLKAVRQASAFKVEAPYRFGYLGLNDTDSTVFLPNRSDNTRDYFGYSNADVIGYYQSELQEVYVYPDLPEAERYRHVPIKGYMGEFYYFAGRSNTPSQRALEGGMLHEVVYPTGGATTIYYEPNVYYDANHDEQRYGGGLRVRELRVHDGVDHAHDLITRYYYEDGNGHSSGVLTNYPQLNYNLGVFFNPDDSTVTGYGQLAADDNETKWKKTLIRTKFNQNYDPLNSNPYVSYSRVRIVTPGGGYTAYSYQVALPYGQEQTSDWQATKNRLARSTVSGTYQSPGFVRYRYGYPFASQTNYNYKQGLLLRQEVYAEGDTLMSSSRYTYHYTYGAELKAIRKERVPTVYTSGGNSYSKDMYIYNIYTIRLGTQTLADSVIATTYDPDGYDQAMTVSTCNHYKVINGTSYLYKQSSIGPDGVEYLSYTIYNHDYTGTVDSTDTVARALQRMQADGLTGIPVEQISTMIVPGGSEQLTGASLQTYQYVGNLLRPLRSYVLREGVPFAYDAATFDSRIDANGRFVFDSRYEWTEQTLLFDTYGNILTTRSFDGQYNTVLYGYGGRVPIMQVTGTRADALAFSNFEYDSRLNLQPAARDLLNSAPAGSLLTGSGRNGGNCFVLTPTNSTGLQQQINKDTRTGRYILSFWALADSPVTITATLSDASGNTQSTQVAVTAGSEWQYYETYTDITSLDQAFDINLTASDTAKLDDVVFYPDFVTFSYTSFDQNGLKTAVTDSYGNSEYYEYNAYNDLAVVRDRDKNVVQRITRSRNDGATEAQPYITFERDILIGVPHEFRLLNSGQISGATFYWQVVPLSQNPPLANPQEHNFAGATVVSDDNTVTFTFNSQPAEDQVLLAKVTYNGSSHYAAVLLSKAYFKLQYLFDICSKGNMRIDICGQQDGLPTDCAQISATTGTSFYVEVAGDASGYDIIRWYKSNDPQSKVNPYYFIGNGEATLLGTGNTVTVSNYDNENMYIICTLFKNTSTTPVFVAVSDDVRTIQVFNSCSSDPLVPGNPIE